MNVKLTALESADKEADVRKIAKLAGAFFILAGVRKCASATPIPTGSTDLIVNFDFGTPFRAQLLLRNSAQRRRRSLRASYGTSSAP